MKNIRNIISHDIKKCTQSMVAIITIMGLCIIPCLYAWFNIFSNWAPYEEEATGRISVAVASEDEGADMMGISVNVGDKIIEALRANNAIGWEFYDTKAEALDKVYSSDCYAALIVPQDFSSGVLSFVTGDLENPKLLYYENEKKNAIAPKITGKAKTAVQEEVNATFVETLADLVSKAASVADATGFNPQSIFGDLGEKLSLLGDRLDNCIVMIDAARSLSDAAENLLIVSGTLTDSAQDAVTAEKSVLDTAATDTAPAVSEYTKVTEYVSKITSTVKTDLNTFEQKVEDGTLGKEEYNNFYENDLDKQKALVEEMQKANDKAASALRTLGLDQLAEEFDALNADLKKAGELLDQLEPATDENWAEMQAKMEEILTVISGDSSGEGAKAKVNDIADSLEDSDLLDLDKKMKKALEDARKAMASMRQSLDNLSDLLGDLGNIFDRYNGSLGKLEISLGSTKSDLLSLQRGLDVLAALMNEVAGNEDLKETDRILTEYSDSFASYLASPVKMNTEVIYPIETYGSAMAPFYTVLAQWVGALLTAVLIKVKVRKRDDLPSPHLTERFFGRYALYLIVGLAQALIVSLGDLLYVGIQCHHPVLFVLEACVNGICFMMINYALVFALDNIGLGAGVIILVLQVAGSGGTYPVEVLPPVFRALYPFMPFRYAMDAMRECIGGTYDHTYAKCVGILGIFTTCAVIFGLLLYKPALKLNKMISESKRKSDIML